MPSPDPPVSSDSSRRPNLPALLVGLALIVAAWSSPRVGSGSLSPAEAINILAAESLLEDGDLRIDDHDVARGRKLGIAPEEISTRESRDGAFFGQPIGYVLLALPAVAVMGVRGFLVLNALLLMMTLVLAMATLRGQVGGGTRDDESVLWVAGFFLASGSLFWVFRFEPFLAAGMVLTIALILLRLDESEPNRIRALSAGWLLGWAFSLYPLLVVPATVAAIGLLFRRRNVDLLWLFSSLALACCALGGARWGLAGETFREAMVAEFLNFDALSSLRFPGPEWTLWEASLGRRVKEVLWGRQAGLIPYFPFALIALLAFLRRGPRKEWRWCLAGLAMVYTASVVWLRSPDPAPWASGLGDPHFIAVYPLLFLLPVVVPRAPAVLAAWLLAAAFVLPVIPILGAVSASPVLLTNWAPYRILTPEVETIAFKGMQGYVSSSWGDQSWFFPKTVFYFGEKNPAGVWMRGDSEGDVVVLSAKPLSELTLVAQSLTAEGRLRLDGGADLVVTIVFDTKAKREGTRVAIPVTAERAKSPSGDETYLHRLRVRMVGGVAPSEALGGSGDKRFLGAFLRPEKQRRSSP